MKIMTLNIWGGRAGREELLSFLSKHKNDVDIFCFQEVWSSGYEHLDGTLAGGVPLDIKKIMTSGVQDISELLSEHTKYFRPHFMDDYGLLMMVNKKHKIIAEGEKFVYKEKGYIAEGDYGNHARNIQYVTLVIDDKPVTVINTHGLWNGKGKTDTQDRLNQSKNTINFIESLDGDCVFCGDLNLLPDTKSIKLFEDAGLMNLIKKHDIQSTRTSFYKKPEKFADYIFVSEGLREKSFEVLPDEVSDHSPLVVEI